MVDSGKSEASSDKGEAGSDEGMSGSDASKGKTGLGLDTATAASVDVDANAGAIGACTAEDVFVLGSPYVKRQVNTQEKGNR